MTEQSIENTGKSIAEHLADRALAAAANPDRDALRALFAYNIGIAMSTVRGAETLTAASAGDTSPGARAFHYASRIYARAQDDWYNRGRSHIGTLAIPGALAADCDDLFVAAAAGYAVMMPVSGTYGLEAHLRGLRPTALFGHLAAAASCGVALGANAQQLVSAIALSTVTAGGHTQCMLDETDEWRYNVLTAARNGADAAALAVRGARGTRLTFEGEQGWAVAMFGDKGASKLWATLAEAPEGPADVSIKPYPASGGTFAAIFGALEARRRTGGARAVALSIEANGRVLSLPGSFRKGPFASPLGSALAFAPLCAEAYVTGGVKAAAKPASIQAEINRVEALMDIRTDDSLHDLQVHVTVASETGVHSFDYASEAVQFPGWPAIRKDPADLAERCEAPVEKIRRLFDLLDRDVLPSKEVIALIAAGH